MKMSLGAKLIDNGCRMVLLTVMFYCFLKGSYLEGLLAVLTFICGATSFSIFSYYRENDE